MGVIDEKQGISGAAPFILAPFVPELGTFGENAFVLCNLVPVISLAGLFFVCYEFSLFLEFIWGLIAIRLVRVLHRFCALCYLSLLAPPGG